MKKVWKKFLPAGLAILWLAAVMPQAALAAAKEETDRFVHGTRVNNVSVSGMTIEEARHQIEQYYKGYYTLKIQDAEGREASIKDTDIGYQLTVTGDLNEVLQQVNENGRKSGPGEANYYWVGVETSFDEAKLQSILAGLPFVTEARPTTDAYISPYEEGKEFSIIPETVGTELEMERFAAVVKTALNEQRTVLKLQEEDCYKKVRVSSTDETLNRMLDTMNRFREVTITYSFGDRQEILSGEEIAKWVKGTSGTDIQVDEAMAAAYVQRLSETYDTYGRPHPFHTTAGNDIAVNGNYGWQIDQAAETAALVAAVKTCQSQTREPAYVRTAASRSGNDYGLTYVEVDLANQHLYLYENGTCIVECPIVTGNVSRGHTTPEGLYTLNYKERNRVLRGKKLADGSYEYESPVKYWMPFNGGIGLHDANWRGKFGGTIYRTSGSHGCVNMPPQSAAVVYEHVYKGIPVICHNNQ
ncbi:MAG: L,D-transpeptidase family protein [Lachnospiraceae bacterium]|jgi:lipoprotein-anchoring transpeptidase ErfK/SrfK|nr:L,D-transpeptidase family protein [Lachnospiraceae bacterium]